MVSVQDTSVIVNSHPVRLRGRGQITIPSDVRERLNVSDGDTLALIQIGDIIVLAPKQPQVPRLADKIAEMMETEDVSLAELLLGLQEERETIWRERQKDA